MYQKSIQFKLRTSKELNLGQIFNLKFLYRQAGGGGMNHMNSSPSYGAFSFPKLNGSPSRPYNVHTGVSGGGMNGGVGSGAGFMGFGPTGFTTPIDTVLDRFGRTGTIFPSSNNHQGNGIPPNYGPNNHTVNG